MKKLPKNEFLYSLTLTFIFIATSALAISSSFNQSLVTSYQSSITKNFPPIPKLKENTTFPVVSAQAVMAVDLTSGITLYEKNPDTALLPASTTKIVTALVSMDNYDLNQTLKVGRVNVVGQKMRLFQGEEISVVNLLYGLLVYSANDSAEVLAANFPGGREKFIEAMNKKAEELNMKNSKFVNPTGLDGNTATARDLLRVSEVAMKDPIFAKIVSTKEITVTDKSSKFVHKLKNINELLGETEGVMGVKTGWTENARENLVTYMERDGHKIMIVALGSQDRFGETKELINWIFNSYEWKKVGYTYSP